VTKISLTLRFFRSAKDNPKFDQKFKPNRELQMEFTRPDFYNFCNFVRKAASLVINWPPATELKCLQKLHACFHTCNKIKSFLLVEANVLLI